IGGEVREVHVVVAAREQRVAQRCEDARLVAAEVVGEDQIQRRPDLGLVVVVPLRVVPAAASGHLVRGQTEEEEVLLSGLLGHLDRRASRVPMVTAPYIMNFMLLVPLAS